MQRQLADILKQNILEAIDKTMEANHECETCRKIVERLSARTKSCTPNQSALELLDKVLSEHSSQIQTQQALSSAESSKDTLIESLQQKISLLQEQKDSLQAEFMRQSSEWKKIKEKLRQRQSLRTILGTTLTDEKLGSHNDAYQENREPNDLTNGVIDFSEDSPTQEPLKNTEDGINLLADALDAESQADMSDNLPKRVDSGHGSDCPCCSRFYQAICKDRDEMRDRKNLVSRHKVRQTMPNTPPGFWNVGFTQK